MQLHWHCRARTGAIARSWIYRHQMAYDTSSWEVLDGLRGVLALMILWHHVPYIPEASLAPIAFSRPTAFFIVLSGFSCARGYANKTWTVGSILQFYRKRLIRIFPLCLLWWVLLRLLDADEVRSMVYLNLFSRIPTYYFGDTNLVFYNTIG